MKENWIQWKSGDCPVSGEKYLSIKFRNEDTSNGLAKYFRWNAEDNLFDIVAFRFINDADDNWVDIVNFNKCPVMPDTSLEIKNTNVSVAYSIEAKDFNSWGCFYEKTVYFRILKEEKKKDTDGWIEWHGGHECPVDDHDQVLIRFRINSSTYDGITVTPNEQRWWHNGGEADIVAYKIIKEQKEPQKPIKETPKTSKPVDLLWGSW